MRKKEIDFDKHIRFYVAIIAVIILAGISLYIISYILTATKIFPSSIITILLVGIVIIVGYLIIRSISNALFATLIKKVDKKRLAYLKFFFNFIAYFILFMVVLYLLKVDLTNLLLGATFLGLVIGLAAQTVLGNLFAGILVVTTKPVEVGERVTISTWQYGLLAPTYSPKFYSNDFIVPGYTGTIDSIGFLYITMISDDNREIKIPNGIFFQALIINHSKYDHCVVRTRYEIKKELDPDKVMNGIRKQLSSNRWIYKNSVIDIYVSEATMNSYVLIVSTTVKGTLEEPPRSDIIRDIMKAVSTIKPESDKLSG
ncbi:MAG: mechanosensitive ion channel family protein [Candidatus Thermoplasmatota archaeon]|jgi:small-conductance mechanosensitive channel|nr:mechanosensitive ion channel family protein [Candidatus Thermoplasmatota archaeon]MCL5963649.1 mechanosensitive ion channel family protein [Candidatus Thermoplasmatota archaeon]